MEQYEKLLEEDLFLKALKEDLDLEKTKLSVSLTGGAVVDILRGVKPKDYDFTHTPNLEKIMRDNKKFQIEYVTKSAVTFTYLNRIIQLIFKSTSDFPYTIEQGVYNLTNNRLTNFDSDSFEFRLLIPTKACFEDKYKARCAIQRLIHHQTKGWNMRDITFQSLCNTAFKADKTES